MMKNATAQPLTKDPQNNILPYPDAILDPTVDFQPERFDSNPFSYETDDAMSEPEEIFQAGSIPYQPGKLSTASRLRTVLFEEITGRKAGESIPSPPDTASTSPSNVPEQPPFYPFHSGLDYALAMFFHQRQLTKGDVTAFFQDDRLSPIFKLLSFHNADEWLEKLNSIPYGLSINNWKKETISVPSPISGTGPQLHEVQYQEVENVIRFFLGHIPFKNNLTYSPIRLWNDNDSRVYTEMWTGDWWWEMQKTLPEGATVVPLLIGIDKTVLTQHHGDLSAWPIYMTIGNLDSSTRRQQTRPSLMLIGFMPVLEGYKRLQKAEIYHYILRKIFKCKPHLLFKLLFLVAP
jgi:hypothetical protein